MNEFEHNLFEAIQNNRVVSREIEKYNHDAHNAAIDAALKTAGVSHRWDLDPMLYPKLDNFKYSTPIVTDHVSEAFNDEDGGRSLYDFVYMLEASSTYGVDIDGFGNAVYVDSYGGEGQGDQYWVVFKLTKDEHSEPRHFKLDGYYASYDGGYYDNLYEVFPKVVMRTEWGS